MTLFATCVSGVRHLNKGASAFGWGTKAFLKQVLGPNSLAGKALIYVRCMTSAKLMGSAWNPRLQGKWSRVEWEFRTGEPLHMFAIVECARVIRDIATPATPIVGYGHTDMQLTACLFDLRYSALTVEVFFLKKARPWVQTSPYVRGLRRWASLDDEEPQEERSSKRAAKRAAIAAKGVASPTGSELRPKNRWDSGAPTVAKKPGLKKSVRWADEVVHTGGFSIGGASKQQVTTQTSVTSCRCIASILFLLLFLPMKVSGFLYLTGAGFGPFSDFEQRAVQTCLLFISLHPICATWVDYVQGYTRFRGCVRFRTACLRVTTSH